MGVTHDPGAPIAAERTGRRMWARLDEPDEYDRLERALDAVGDSTALATQQAS